MRMMVKPFSFLLLLAGLAEAQPFVAGVKIGAPLTDALSVQSPNPLDYVANTGRFVVGPYVEVRLPAGFAVEVDALYRSVSFSSTQNSASASDWEFPVLAKRKFLKGPLRPYVEGGLVLSHLSVPDVTEVAHRSNYGIALGAGLEIHALVLHISPEIRYEGLIFQDLSSPGGTLHSNRNQLLAMVGISF
jgi:opacity protein-like surface antigen